MEFRDKQYDALRQIVLLEVGTHYYNKEWEGIKYAN